LHKQHQTLQDKLCNQRKSSTLVDILPEHLCPFGCQVAGSAEHLLMECQYASVARAKDALGEISDMDFAPWWCSAQTAYNYYKEAIISPENWETYTNFSRAFSTCHEHHEPFSFPSTNNYLIP
jgi:hypothetical protein